MCQTWQESFRLRLFRAKFHHTEYVRRRRMSNSRAQHSLKGSRCSVRHALRPTVYYCIACVLQSFNPCPAKCAQKECFV